jgi:hypothetical protein
VETINRCLAGRPCRHDCHKDLIARRRPVGRVSQVARIRRRNRPQFAARRATAGENRRAGIIQRTLYVSLS